MDSPEFELHDRLDDISAISRADIEAFQLFKLKNVLKFALQKSRFYKKMFHETGILPDDIKNIDDFVQLPLTEPDNLVETPHKLVCVSLKEFAQEYLFDTSGTEGKPKRVVCTQNDIDRMIEFMSAGMWSLSKSGDTIMLILPGGRPNSQSDLLSQGVEKMGGESCDL